jgi:hypothetical protein
MNAKGERMNVASKKLIQAARDTTPRDNEFDHKFPGLTAYNDERVFKHEQPEIPVIVFMNEDQSFLDYADIRTGAKLRILIETDCWKFGAGSWTMRFCATNVVMLENGPIIGNAVIDEATLVKEDQESGFKLPSKRV